MICFPKMMLSALLLFLVWYHDVSAEGSQARNFGPSPFTGWSYRFDKPDRKINYEGCVAECKGLGGRVPLDPPEDFAEEVQYWLSESGLERRKDRSYKQAFWYGYRTNLSDITIKEGYVDENNVPTMYENWEKEYFPEPNNRKEERCATVLAWSSDKFGAMNNLPCDRHIYCICQMDTESPCATQFQQIRQGLKEQIDHFESKISTLMVEMEKAKTKMLDIVKPQTC